MQFKSVFMNGSYYVKLDFDNLDFEERASIEPYLITVTPTYKKLAKDGGNGDVWATIFGSANWVFKQMTDEEKIYFAKGYAVIMRTVQTEMPTVGGKILAEGQLMHKIGEYYLEIVNHLKLLELFDKYSHLFVKMGDMSEIGTRPQDSPELTFMEPEMRQLIVISLLCKMLAPVLGTIMNLMPDVMGGDGKLHQPTDREQRCACVMTPLIETHYKRLNEKFLYYLNHTVKGQTGGESDAAAVFAGYTAATRTSIIYANLLVRNFINIDLCYNDSNIMRFCDSIARTLVGTQDSKAKQNQVKTRVAFGAATGGDDGNIAQMEVDSVASNRTYDVPMIVRSAVKPTIQKYSMRYDIDPEDFSKAETWFLTHPIYPTTINQFVLCSCLGPCFGGGKGVQHLEAPDYARLVAILQLSLFTIPGMIPLAHLISATPSALARMKFGVQDDQLTINYSQSYAFKNLKAKFELSPVSSNGREWDQQVAEIAQDLHDHIYLYNTPPFIYDLMQIDDLNGREIVNNIDSINGMCTFIEQCLNAENLYGSSDTL